MHYLHTMLRISDIQQSLYFFCDLLGFVEVRRKENAQNHFTLIFLAAPSDLPRAEKHKTPLLELTYNWNQKNYSAGDNFGHIALQVDNIYQLCQKLADNGITIHRPPRDGYMAFVRSPDGISFELLQRGTPLPPMEPWSHLPNIGSW